MKIAIATDDKIDIRKGHFGECNFFCIVELEGNEIISKTFVSNPHQAHETPQKAKRISELLPDINVIIAKGFGLKSLQYLSTHGIKMTVSTELDIEKSIQNYITKQPGKLRCYDTETEKFVALKNRGFSDFCLR